MFLILITIALFSEGLLPRFDTWVHRIEGFVDPNDKEHYQVQQSKIAVATGGLIGKMPGNSTQRNFLPQPYNDYVYAIIVEEYGILGGITVILLYMIIFFRSIKIARKCELKFGSFLVFGISFLMVLQAMINMGVAVDLLPVTGQTLPFLSMGGTSLWFSCIGLGIILSVSKNIQEQNAEEPATVNYATA
jgi:cell division protein FtsW